MEQLAGIDEATDREASILTSSDYDLAALQAGLSEYFASSAEGSFNWVDVAR